MTANVQQPRSQPHVWIFQANPARYSIFHSLVAETEEYWNLRQHADHVRSGHRVLIWINGANAGIYAIGTVTTDPILRPDSPTGVGYWTDPAEGLQPRARVLVHYDHVFTDHPLRKAYLQADPLLWNMRILRNPRGTNFPVSASEWQALQEWLED